MVHVASHHQESMRQVVEACLAKAAANGRSNRNTVPYSCQLGCQNDEIWRALLTDGGLLISAYVPQQLQRQAQAFLGQGVPGKWRDSKLGSAHFTSHNRVADSALAGQLTLTKQLSLEKSRGQTNARPGFGHLDDKEGSK